MVHVAGRRRLWRFRNSLVVIEAGRAENALHRQWLDSDPSDVQPMFEDDVNHKAGHNGDAVIQLHRWRHGNRPLRTPPEGNAVCNCPRKEAAK